MNPLLEYYSRKDIQQEIIRLSKNREIVAVFSDKGFGKRPDILQYEQDILELVKRGATSFHVSEEHWTNPLLLKPGMTKSQLDSLRTGFDLILDIDGPFEYSQIAAYLIVEALKYHNLNDISTKFSVSGDTPLLIRNKNKIELLEIKEVINLLKNKQNVEVLSLDNKGYIKYRRIECYLEHKDKIIEVYHQQNSLPIKITPHHSVFVWNKGKIVTKKGSDLTLNDYLITYNSSKNIKNEFSNKVKYIFYYNKNKINKSINITKDLMKLIGYYLSEGHITKRIYQIGFSFNINEKEYISDCMNLLRKNYKNKKISLRNPNKSTQQILVHSKEIYEFFNKFCGKGAKNKHLPYFAWNLPFDYVIELLKGYINGDGWLKGKYDIRIKSVSKRLILELIWLCKMNNISCSLYKEKVRPHMMPQGNMFKGSLVYVIRIPKSELYFSNLKKERNKFSPYPRDKTLPVDALKEIYHQIKPKRFIQHRSEQVTLNKKLANLERIRKVIHWFKKYRLNKFDKETKRIIKNYEILMKSDINTIKIKRIIKKGKQKVYDISVKETENFFGGCYPILLHNSGNKGFHIGIPFSSFPEKVNNIDTRLLFPDAPKIIASYLKEFIREKLRTKILEKYPIEEILNTTKKQKEEILYKICKKCEIKATEKVIISYECKKCHTIEETSTEDYLECPNCKSSRTKKKKLLVECPTCKNQRDFKQGEFNPFSVVDIDTVLISNRHMYRSVFSYHEKSGLISIPIDPDSILGFKKEQAKIENVKTDIQYLKESSKPEASQLIMQAFDFQKKQEKVEIKTKIFELPTKAIPQKYFPPCLLKGLSGLQDGKKRFLFILINFLKSLGYNHQEIVLIVQEWNKRNNPPLRENYIIGQLNYNKNSKPILPPNCSNESYYKSLGICCPDNLCKLVKNPVNYALRKSRFKEEKINVKKSKNEL